MKIAIVGSGISGLVAGHFLAKKFDVHLFEKNDYLGGHTHTVDEKIGASHYYIDTGFIVFNDRTYPRFKKLLNEIDVQWRDTEMSFSVQDPKTGLEYNGHTLATLFAQKRNLLRPSFYQLLFGIVRFNRLAKQALEQGEDVDHQTLGEFLREKRINKRVSELYLLPMISAIWSSTLAEAEQFPLGFFLRFFNHHGLLNIADRPQWHTLIGGSRAYIPALTQQWQDNIHLQCGIARIERQQEQVMLVTEQGEEQYFDEVILACHSDQALRLLADASADEKDILGRIGYQPNDVVLHTDTALLPKRKAAWASWNYRLREAEDAQQQPSSVTYNMNILQGIEASETFCVTLNNTQAIDPAKIRQRFQYDHPSYSVDSFRAREQRQQICGKNHTHFCGAYWYSGFHEDGVRSAMDVLERFDALPACYEAVHHAE